VIPVSHWSNGERTLAYADIKTIEPARVSRQRFLYIHHGGGKFTVVASMLPSASDFDELVAQLNRSSLFTGPSARRRAVDQIKIDFASPL